MKIFLRIEETGNKRYENYFLIVKLKKINKLIFAAAELPGKIGYFLFFVLQHKKRMRQFQNVKQKSKCRSPDFLWSLQEEIRYYGFRSDN